MKQITCEMCGSTELIKEDGLFVCQSCGIKYTVEEAKKMMVEVEGTVEVKGTIKVDSSDEIENLMLRAKQFEESNQSQRAIEYYNKVLDIDASNQNAQSRITALSISSIYIGTTKVSRETIQKIDNLMASNQKLQAIKMVREITGFGLGLAEAKTWVENYQEYDLHQCQTFGSGSQTQNSAGTGSSGGCYVATCVYGSYDCPEVWTLRRFRDNVLATTWYGRAFIRTYYAISPTLVRWFGETSWFKKMWHGTLDKMVSKFQANGVESTPYEDKIWR